MSEGQNDFAARLARINAKNEPQRPEKPVEVEAAPEIPAEMEVPPEPKGGFARTLVWGVFGLGVCLILGTGAMVALNETGIATVARTDTLASAAVSDTGTRKPHELMPIYSGPDWWEGDETLASLFGPKLHEGRTVIQKVRVPASEATPDGGDLNEEEVREALAAGFGASLNETFCAEMETLLAARCEMQEATADLIFDGRYVELSAAFQFSPRGWIGQATTSESGETFSARADLIPSPGVVSSADARRDAYAEAVSLCGGLRAIYGNCAIETLTFSGTTTGGETMLTADAVFRVHADRAIHDAESVAASLDRAVSAREGAIRMLGFFAGG